jgi:hypothetical protein
VQKLVADRDRQKIRVSLGCQLPLEVRAAGLGHVPGGVRSARLAGAVASFGPHPQP